MSKVYSGENLSIMKTFPSEIVDLIYIDPPFNTGKIQNLTSVKSTRNSNGVVGFGGNLYENNQISSFSYSDKFVDYLDFIVERVTELYRLLKSNGSFYIHLDYREVHYVKVELDKIFGRDNFINELIWAYDYGAKPKTRWPAKHDNILFYVKDREHYTFNVDDIEREPYMAPGLVTKEKQDRGKLPTDVWWHTIVPTNGKERTGYPTQKPEGILKRIITASSNPGDIILDCFAGSGTTGKVAYDCGRNFVLIDENPDAIDIMKYRFGYMKGIDYERSA